MAETGRIIIMPRKSGNTQNHTAVLSAAGWADGVQLVTVTGMLASSRVDVSVAANASLEQLKEYGKCYCRAVTQAEGSLTFICETVPSMDIPIVIGEVF